MEEKYLSALNKILKLASENKEFGDALRKGLCGSVETQAPPAVSAPNQESTKIDLIYEYCIKQIMSEQAKLFYAPFVDYDIHGTLVDDYVRMEDFRRKNNFKDYTLALYQQIEMLTNVIFANDSYRMLFKSMLNLTAYSAKNKQGVWEKVSVGTIVFGKDVDAEHKYYTTGVENLYKNKSTAKEKMRLVVYALLYLGENYDWKAYTSFTDTLYNIYLCRNLNHRGVTQTDSNSNRLEKVLKNTSWSYFEFNNALVEYVRIMNLDDARHAKILDYMPCTAVITSKMPSAAFVKIDKADNAIQVPGQFFNKVNSKAVGETMIVVCVNNVILNIID